ncbi:IS1380-Spn1 transposase [Streptococcus pneumoniae]|nr:IS1380-Spn1 transposase [Streptococcus pneumoniae]CWC52145.1 IS1380-Spn1 transposase [Streptococcus pneumoniae]SNM66322.1 IS1380-Spn1 transposase [Streptococcus pneumoniae]VNE41158.1 IS1380-Spn1 transposase [Streptococcus pneumoniae]
MNSLPNHHFQNKSFYQLSFDGGHLTQYGGLIFFQELFSQLKLKERISKYLVTNDQRRYCRYSDSDILVQFLFQLLTGKVLLITPTIVLMAIILFMLSRGRQVIVSMPSFVLVIVIVLKRQTALSHLF